MTKNKNERKTMKKKIKKRKTQNSTVEVVALSSASLLFLRSSLSNNSLLPVTQTVHSLALIH